MGVKGEDMSFERQMYADMIALRSELEQTHNDLSHYMNEVILLQIELAETKDRAQMYADNIIITLNRAEKAESELSRYKSGVECQGFIDEDGSILVDYEVRDTLWKEFYNCKRVKVLVMPCEKEDV